MDVETMGPEAPLGGKGIRGQMMGQEVGGEGPDIPEQKEEEGKLEIMPGLARALRPGLQNREHKEQGNGEKEMAHLVDIIAFRWTMDLNRHGWSRPQKEKGKKSSAGSRRCTEALKEQGPHHQLRPEPRFCKKTSSLVSKHPL